LEISYGGKRVGAAGLGWDVRLSYIYRDTTIAHHRPARQRLSITLGGQSIVLVRNSADSAWLGQLNAQQIKVRDAGVGTMVMYDGEGRTFTFSAKGATAGSALVNGNLFLLTNIRGTDGNQAAIDYDIGAPTLPGGGVGLAINIKELSYNVNPTTTTCFKNRIVLSYGAALSTPLAMTTLGGVVMARLQTLTSVTVGARATCADSSSTTLRTYALSYSPDTDTQLPRLQSVTVTGQQGTAEASVRLPIGTYSYGSIVDPTTRRITYVPVANSGPPFVAGKNLHTFGISYTTSVPSPEPHGGGDTVNDLFTVQSFVDLNGDGRPDLYGDGNYYPNTPGPDSSTSLLVADATGISLNPSEKIHSAVIGGAAFSPVRINPSINDTLRQLIDINGDGRLDVVETVLPDIDHWIIHLNRPHPTDPKKSFFIDISVPVASMRAALNSTGISFGRVPLARRTTVPDVPGSIDNLRKHTITEFALRDINGDGYPDFVYNSSHVDPATGELSSTRNVKALINTAGVHLAAEANLFSGSPITLEIGGAAGCGIERWGAGDISGGILVETCGFEDVNGDGLLDRIRSIIQDSQRVTQAALGTAVPEHPYATDALITLPGPLAQTETSMWLIDLVQIRYYVPSACRPPTPGPSFETVRTRGLRDINGDGIPDYVARDSGGTTWTVAIGTGASFTAPVIVNSPVGLELSREKSVCGAPTAANEVSATPTGLYDIDGDGQPEIVANADPTTGAQFWNVYQLKPPAAQIDAGSVASVPAAGRLTKIDNGYGAITRIAYKSAKEDTVSAHLVPFPEIVVSAVTVTDSSDNKLVSSTRYAYGRAELMFDSGRDAFVFRGYERTVALRGTNPENASEGFATITDAYPLPPFIFSSFPDALSRFKRYQQAGRVSDVTTVSGSVGTDAYALLTTNIANNTSRTSGVHYTYDARLLPAGRDMAGNESCTDVMHPYNYSLSITLALSDDQCTQMGFSFLRDETAWRGAPWSSDPFASTTTVTVKTKTSVRSVDAFGRVTEQALLKDQTRTDDDLCVRTVYATPTGTNEGVLSAVASRTTAADDCTGTAPIIASEKFEYDTTAAGVKLPAGQVAAGLVTAHTVSRRRSDNGALIGDSRGNSDIRLFDAIYDAAGNPISMTKQREDGAKSTVTAEYDAFGLAPVSVSADATNAGGTKLPLLLTTFTVDPITLDVTNITDPNGTQSGRTYDGFGRVLLSTVTPSGGGASGVLSSLRYLGFAEESDGRRVVQKVFIDPVAPSAVTTAAGRTGTTFMDSLGRVLGTDVQLGADYDNKIMHVGQRTYDLLGRVFFEADAFPSDQSFATAYGTTHYFNPDGTRRASIRGRGQQAVVAANNEANEYYPTFYFRTFLNNTERVDVADPEYWRVAAFGGRPAYHRATYSAAGQLLSRSTWNANEDDNEVRLESMDFSYDRLGQLTRLTRYGNPISSLSPVDTSWKYDSLGQVLEFSEPDSATQIRTYDNWGELTQVQWSDATTSPATDRRTMTTYDALGRKTHAEDRTNNVVDAETVNSFQYDQPVNNTTPPVTATNVLGRLSKATSPTSTVSFSYDGLGQVNAEVFTDKITNEVYVEKVASHADGSPLALDLLLPDTQFTKIEHVDYTYDSAGRTRSVTYNDGAVTQPVFTASGSGAIDAFGRIRQAQYGAAIYTADFADSGRRLINSVKVTSPGGSGENSRELSFRAPTGFVSAFDPLGRERGRRETKTVNGASTVSTLAFAYNLLRQLESVTRTPSIAALPNMSFGYDSIGNIVTLSDPAGASSATLSYQSVDRDRICSIAYGTGTPSSTCNVQYDGVGNIKEQPTRSNGLRTYSYFANGQVKRVTDNTGNDAQFRYDALGNLDKLDLSSLTSADTRHDRHFGGLISTREEVVAGINKTVVMRSIPGPGVVATRHGSATSDPWTFAFGESRGNRFFTDQSGAFVQDVDYQAYGEAKSTGAQPGSPSYSSNQWNNGDALAALGLSQLGARLYDPVIGRFISRDPRMVLHSAAKANPYTFAYNDPVNSSDPTGLTVMQEGPDAGICMPECPDSGGGGGGGGGGDGDGGNDGGDGDGGGDLGTGSNNCGGPCEDTYVVDSDDDGADGGSIADSGAPYQDGGRPPRPPGGSGGGGGGGHGSGSGHGSGGGGSGSGGVRPGSGWGGPRTLPSGNPFLLQSPDQFVYNGPDPDGALALGSLNTPNKVLAAGAVGLTGGLALGTGIVTFEGVGGFVSWMAARFGLSRAAPVAGTAAALASRAQQSVADLVNRAGGSIRNLVQLVNALRPGQEVSTRALQQVIESTGRTFVGPFPYGNSGSVILLPQALGGPNNAVIDSAGVITIIELSLETQLQILKNGVP
jgi:RHS repeat-associated protein